MSRRARPKDDETVIKGHIRDALEATQAKRPSDILERVAENFKTRRGLKRAEIKRILVGRLLRDQWVRVFERSLDVTVEGEKATVVLRTLVAQGDKIERIEDLVPTDADALRFDIKLEKRTDGWWIVEADYRQDGLTP